MRKKLNTIVDGTLLLSGNEAIARGAWESGVHFASAYPGTPSTEILETIGDEYDEIDAQWAPNEKVSLEVIAGASFSGARVLSAMKHVGLNVAADPLFTLSYIGATGGMVIISADDPGMHSSQNEQDNRLMARAAKVVCLEPSDSQEAKDMVGEALLISEDFDTPVL
ncbi:MAG: indolepyruvate ferredoxin oxidoreductase subunit alpha, partial [Candidatus Aegiribacteria sp.]|nr:indolepyruvate ferredoxin oxidoreductase subunit alpha [Candidatus Aegiribacteria sp.]